MRKNNIKKIIKDSFKNETPDFLMNIKSSCQNIPQIESNDTDLDIKTKFNYKIIFRRVAFCAVCFIMFVLGILIGNIDTKSLIARKNASIYFDLNPSIEIQIDENNNVINSVALNEDARVILDNISLVGVDLNTAVYSIVGSMYANGYLNSENNSILVSVDGVEGNNLLTDISNQINTLFKENDKMDCSVIAQNITKDEILETLSSEYNVSIGKMYLVKKLLLKCDYLNKENFEELVEMSIHDLDLLYKSVPNNEENNDIEKDELVTGKPSAYIEKDTAYDYLANMLDIDINDVECYNVTTVYRNEIKHEYKMVYFVAIQFKNQEIQNYVIDCFTGELLSEDVVDKWKDKLDKENQNEDKDNYRKDDINHNNKK